MRSRGTRGGRPRTDPEPRRRPTRFLCMRVALSLIALAAAAACSQEPAPSADAGATSGAGADESRPAAGPTRAAEVDAPEPEPAPVPGRAYRYTSLADCEVVREERAEMPFTEVRCGGAGGWDVLVSDADARQRLELDGPG